MPLDPGEPTYKAANLMFVNNITNYVLSLQLSR